MFTNGNIFITFNEGSYNYVVLYNMALLSPTYYKKLGSVSIPLKMNSMFYMSYDQNTYQVGNIGGYMGMLQTKTSNGNLLKYFKFAHS